MKLLGGVFIQYVKGDYLGLVHLGGVPIMGTPSAEQIATVAEDYRKLILVE